MHIFFAQSAKPNTDKLTMVGTVGNLRNLAVEILQQTDILQHDSKRTVTFDITGRHAPGNDPQYVDKKT